MVTVYLGQLCLHAAADPLNRIEQHVGVELEAEGKLVVAIHVHDARRVPWAAQANLPKMCEMNNVCHMNMVTWMKLKIIINCWICQLTSRGLRLIFGLEESRGLLKEFL